jgi:transposase-like protein
MAASAFPVSKPAVQVSANSGQNSACPLCAHGGRSRAPGRRSNADVRSSVVMAAQMSAAGRQEPLAQVGRAADMVDFRTFESAVPDASGKHGTGSPSATSPDGSATQLATRQSCVREVAARIGSEPWGRWKTEVARYGQAYKERIVARLLPPESSSVEQVSREIGISAATLERWRADALATGSSGGVQRWTAAARLQAVIATATMVPHCTRAHPGS